ncbi:MAG TPA: septum formation initiator family protein [Thermoanaerobaculia bacterium]|nr:septum formation initiator family protein [Thermoanaerobaculia bacterium]
MTDAAPAPRPRSFRAVLGAVVAGALLLLALAGVKSWQDLAAARAREAALEGENVESEERIAQLQGQIERLKSDPSTLERLAREELGLVRPGDVVIVLPPEDAPPARTPAR